MSTVYHKDYDYPVVEGRYRLIVSESCPFAQRADIARSLLGLDDAISLSLVDPIKTDNIWEFSNYENGKDEVLDIAYLSAAYHKTNPDYTGPYSVPALVDIESGKVVNQESLDLVKDFATRFQPLQKGDVPEIYPENLKADIDTWFSRVGSDLIGAGFRAGHATDQETYDKNAGIYWQTLSDLDDILSEADYVVGNQLTAADIVVFTPLIRFEIQESPAYRLFKYQLQDFPHLWEYLHRLYQIPAFKDSTNFEAIAKGTYLGRNGRQHFGKEVLPDLPDLSHWEG